jgi:glycosyl transferase family 25
VPQILTEAGASQDRLKARRLEYLAGMKIYLINLDRHPQRLKRMENLLRGLPFRRIAAVDGRTVAGPEERDGSLPPSCENLSRYEKACTLSHRAAWREFLAGQKRYACILEDDIFISPDFQKFMSDPSWIPPGCDLVKIETCCQNVMLSRVEAGALDRALTELRSLHQGTGAYILSRRGAEILLAETTRPRLPVDFVVFDNEVLRRHGPLLQLVPALCVQAHHLPDGIIFGEMQSSIQPRPVKRPKPLLKRIRLEAGRPFRRWQAAVGRLAFQLGAKARRTIVPYA